MSILISILALTMGTVLGLLGGGGSILTVPILVYAAGLPASAAIASSLVVVGVTAAVSTVSHAKRGSVEWRTGAIFGGVAMIGAYVGGRIAVFVPGWLLLVLFAGLMVATSLMMLGTKQGAASRTSSHALGPLAIRAFFVGSLTGLIGAGGGFIVVPALVLFAGLPMHKAVGTSLFVIALNSAAGVAGHLAYIDIDWALTVSVTAFAVVGSVVGARFSSMIPAKTLRAVFAWFVLAMGIAILSKELLGG